MVVFGGVVQLDRVEGVAGDLLGAGDDGVDRGGPNEVGQAADHAAGALVQVAAEADEAPGAVCAEPQGLLEGGDEGVPVLPLGLGAVAERRGGDGGEPGGDLPAADAGEQPDPFNVDAGVDEGDREPLGEVLQLVGGLGPGAGGQVQVVDLIDLSRRRDRSIYAEPATMPTRSPA